MGEDENCPTGELRRLLEAERQRADQLLGHILPSLDRIEEHLERRLSPEQWVKLITGVLLPLAVLLLTGNAELVRKLLTE